MRPKIIFIFFILFLNGIAYAIPSEKEYLKELNDLASKGNHELLKQTATRFFKDYPKSGMIADVRLILADNDDDPASALEQYKILINKFRYFEKNDLVQYRICEILYLKSKWKELQADSMNGISNYKTSEYITKYKFFLAKAYLHQEQYEKAKEVCLNITETDHSPETLSNALMLLSFINRNIYGLTKSYLYSLGELITGFDESSNIPAALFLLGRYYESRNEFDKAYSAYSDLLRKYPKSPEAEFSKKQLEYLLKHNPGETSYLPGRQEIESADIIDISPEIDLDDAENDNSIQYSVSLGPFLNLKDAEEIKILIDKDFQPVEIIQQRKNFMIYTGRFNDIRSAVNIKIRLAEELGINGNIVKRIKSADNTYIYEE